jgi:hypothetical protein
MKTSAGQIKAQLSWSPILRGRGHSGAVVIDDRAQSRLLDNVKINLLAAEFWKGYTYKCIGFSPQLNIYKKLLTSRI